MRALALMLTLVAVLLGAGTARAETSLYVVDQPEISFVLEGKGDDVYAAYLSAELLCYGAGGHWFEGPDAVTHRAFQVGPVRLHPIEHGFRLVRTHRDTFESWREVMKVKVQSDRIVGTFSYYASGEALQGNCEANAPRFEPSFGEKEPPVSFEASRYVPLGSPLAPAPAPADAALYFQSSPRIETLIWVDGATVTKLRGAAREICRGRRGHREVRNRALEPEPPFSIEPGTGHFEARAGRDWPFVAAASHLEGTAAAEMIFGRYRATVAYRNDRKSRFYERCRTGGRAGDGYVGYQAIRYVPVQPAPG